MKTIIAGSRDIIDYGLVTEAMNRIDWDVTEIVSGGARGIDTLGERWASDNNVSLKIFPADWDTYGKAAGPIRNAQMAKYADALVAIWDGKSRGTSNMIGEAKDLGLKVVVFLESELKDKRGSNPIKNNPIFGEEAEGRSRGESSNIATKTITLNDKHLVVFEDEKRNSRLTNMVLELVKEVKKKNEQ